MLRGHRQFPAQLSSGLRAAGKQHLCSTCDALAHARSVVQAASCRPGAGLRTTDKYNRTLGRICRRRRRPVRRNGYSMARRRLPVEHAAASSLELEPGALSRHRARPHLLFRRAVVVVVPRSRLIGPWTVARTPPEYLLLHPMLARWMQNQRDAEYPTSSGKPG